MLAGTRCPASKTVWVRPLEKHVAELEGALEEKDKQLSIRNEQSAAIANIYHSANLFPSDTKALNRSL